jgi:hypothetical protein
MDVEPFAFPRISDRMSPHPAYRKVVLDVVLDVVLKRYPEKREAAA